jgi:hypothetical protein
MTPTDEMLGAGEGPFHAVKTLLLVVLMVLFPLAMAAFGVWWLLN